MKANYKALIKFHSFLFDQQCTINEDYIHLIYCQTQQIFFPDKFLIHFSLF
jgi:hypothetical protein